LQFSELKINTIKDQGLIESAEARRSSVALAALDSALLARAHEASGAADISIEEYLVRRRVADRIGASVVLREAAVFLFALRPETIPHPNASVRVFRVAGATRLTGAQHNVQEFPRIEGNLPSVLQQARGLLGTLIQRSSRLHDLFFQEMPEYPTFAWQEALVNAVAHRDYAIQGQAVEVWLYDDRLEVWSPGGLPPEVSIDELRAGSRNPRIARALTDLGVMRDQGEGIPRMFEEMESSFLPLPALDVITGRFRVVLQNNPIFRIDDPKWPQAIRALPISLTQKRAMVGLVDRDFSNADYCELNAVDRDTAYRDLHSLIERGLVRATGSGAGTRYRVVRDSVSSAPSTPPPIERLVTRMAEAGFITNTDYRDAFDVDRSTAKTALATWVGQGVLVREGQRRGARYRPGDRWPPL
jgi:ATP-dependent DNA helicase RecG